MASRDDYEDLLVQWFEESRTDTPTASERECTAAAADEMWPAWQERER